MTSKKETIILYHANCPDGFGAAYAAWKKYGDSAEYTPVSHGNPVPEGLEEKEVFIVDFSYPKDILLEIESKTKRLVVLDHHIGAKDAVEAVKEHVFDNNHSGAGITWNYFHLDLPLPRLLAHIEDNDLWKHVLPHGKEISAYLGIQPFTFEAFDAVVHKMEDEKEYALIIEKGRAYSEYYDFICTTVTAQAEEVQFDEFTILAVSAPRLFRSEIGHRLAKQKAPFAIVWYPHEGVWHCSLRGDGSIDLTKIAQRYGGNGHRNAAAFSVSMDRPLPFTFIRNNGS